MRFTKVKLGEPIEIMWEEDGAKDGDTRAVHFKSSDKGHPDLLAAGEALLTVVLARMDLLRLQEAATLRGVSITRDERYGFGFVATLLVTCDNYVSPLVLNSPFVRHPMDEEDPDSNPSAFINADEDEALELLLKEVRDYVSGKKRDQGELFPEDKAA